MVIRIDTPAAAREWARRKKADPRNADGLGGAGVSLSGPVAVDPASVALGCGGPANLLCISSVNTPLERCAAVPARLAQMPRLDASAQTTPLQCPERQGLTAECIDGTDRMVPSVHASPFPVFTAAVDLGNGGEPTDSHADSDSNGPPVIAAIGRANSE